MKLFSKLVLTSAVMTGAVLAQPGHSQRQGAPFAIEDADVSFPSLQEAIAHIGDGQGTITIAPGTYRQCAVQEGGEIMLRARTAGSVIFDGETCEGKAALVLRGRAATIDGLIFQNMKVSDRNGSGIRLEKGNLTVVNTLFRDSEQGILTAGDPSGNISIDHSSFQRLGRCDGGYGCAHSIYIGDFGSLKVTNSRFEQGRGGHYVKSRAARAEIRNNSFDDTQGQATNYVIDLPAGATGTISGNEMVQGKNKENRSAFIAIAAEDKLRPSNGLSIAGNNARLAPGIEWRTIFVADWSGDRLAIGENKLGRGITQFEKR